MAQEEMFTPMAAHIVNTHRCDRFTLAAGNFRIGNYERTRRDVSIDC